MGKEVFLKNVRICYAQNLFKASAFEEGKEPKFNAQFIISKDDTAQVKLMQDAIEAVAKEKWPDDSKTKNRAAGIIKSLKMTEFICFRDGELKPDREELENSYFVAASNKKKPTAIMRDKTEATEADIYSGCYVNVKVEVYAFEYNTKKMIPATLLGVQFVKDGDAFAGGAKVADADEFDDISDVGDNSDDLV